MNIFKKLCGCKKQESEAANLASLYVLRADSYPCDKCNIEGSTCMKLHFADRTICVCPKEEANTFRNKIKRQPKK